MLPCVRRREITRMEKDGTESLIHRCAHTACAAFNKDVTALVCAECPLRLITEELRPEFWVESPVFNREYAQPRLDVDGSLVYETVHGLKPPSAPDGYAKTDDPWVFKPLHPACVHREAANIVQRCGCIKTSAFCASKESAYHKLPVTPEYCSGCPLRSLLQVSS